MGDQWRGCHKIRVAFFRIEPVALAAAGIHEGNAKELRLRRRRRQHLIL